MQTSTLDERIGSLVPDVDEEIRAGLQKLLRTLREVGYPEGMLDIMMRPCLRLMARLFEAAGLPLPSDNLFDRVEKAVKQGVLPDEMGSYLHLIRTLSNKPHHASEKVRLQIADAENALSGFLRVLEWFYCECPYGPRLHTIYAAEMSSPVTFAHMLQAYQEAVRATTQQLARLQEEMETLRKQQIARSEYGQRFLRERIVGPVPDAVAEHFRDRSSELESLRRLLTDENLRLVLVCGRGGIGKTSLITKLLHDMQQEDALCIDTATCEVDSVIYIDLRQVEFRSPDRIVELLYRTLEPQLSRELRAKWRESIPVSNKLEFLFRHVLGQRRYLIVMDNFEDVLDDQNRIRNDYADLREFVEKCVEFDHGARIVVTSRRTLVFSPELEGRTGYRRAEVSLDAGLPDEEAVALLRDLDPDGKLGIRTETDDTLRMVVHRCHGIPRTLETLVGTLRQRRTWTLSRLIADEQAFGRLVEHPSRELFESLSPEERLVVQALSVYNRPVELVAVRYLLPALPVDEILDALVRNYVVRYDRGYFSIHPLDAQYAYRQIPDGEGEYTKTSFHIRAAEFFRKLRKPQDEWEEIGDLDPQLCEFRHLVSARLHDEACQLLNCIDLNYLSLWGYSALVVELRSTLIPHLTDKKLLEDNWGYLGLALRRLGEAQEAVEALQQALKIAQDRGDISCIALWLSHIGDAHRALGDTQQAVHYLERALHIHRSIGDERGEAFDLSNLGNVYRVLNKIAAAIFCHERALEIHRRLQDEQGEARDLNNLGNSRLLVGDIQKAMQHYKEALEIFRQVRDQRGQLFALSNLGKAYRMSGEMQRAIAHYERALEIACRIGDRRWEGINLSRLAQVYHDLGEMQRSIDYYERALNIGRDVGDTLGISHRLCGLGLVYHSSANLNQAEACYTEALDLNMPETRYQCSILLGILCLEKGETDIAQHHFARGASYCKCLLEETPDLCEALYALALSQLASGYLEESLATYRRALAVCAARGVIRSALTKLRLMKRAKYCVAGLEEAISLLEEATKREVEA